MSAFIARRLLLAIPTLFGVLVVAFLLLYVAPGDPVMSMVGERADEATIARLRKELRIQSPLAAGAEGANRLDPDTLNPFERRVLKESFVQARALQSRLALDYQI